MRFPFSIIVLISLFVSCQSSSNHASSSEEKGIFGDTFFQCGYNEIYGYVWQYTKDKNPRTMGSCKSSRRTNYGYVCEEPVDLSGVDLPCNESLNGAYIILK